MPAPAQGTADTKATTHTSSPAVSSTNEMNALGTQINRDDETSADDDLGSIQPFDDAFMQAKFHKLWLCHPGDIVPPLIWPKHEDGRAKLLKHWPLETKMGLTDIALLIKDVPLVRKKLEAQVEARLLASGDLVDVPWLLPEDVEAVYNNLIDVIPPKVRNSAKRCANDALDGSPEKRSKVDTGPPMSTLSQWGYSMMIKHGVFEPFDRKPPGATGAQLAVFHYWKQLHEKDVEVNSRHVLEKEDLKRQVKRYLSDPYVDPMEALNELYQQLTEGKPSQQMGTDDVEQFELEIEELERESEELGF
ncbi:hypothetical protein W97_07259 [Coniosporium apollinis CBS 100218]|uniref:Uncharacterized protein n=1 Tax=Coniosporium apollinis (strain CBS 100218) TaxID=1168221 RepID=R7Z2J1_CONA1|nr:uncharacterized protein W97_07259 [Coniosporium apollinis CBS 100218]EON68111.1 hypothetical protein W97_07259 [Coniosporium apollinis CBS 100218]